jgi:hypothetical protein
MVSSKIVAIVDAPLVTLEEHEEAAEALIKFYLALGWNGVDLIEPRKIQTTQAVYNRLFNVMMAQYSDAEAVGLFMVSTGPNVCEKVPPGKVHLLDGWITPE